MAKTQTKAPEPAESPIERTGAQTPSNFDVRIFGAKNEGTQRATASVNVNGIFAVRGVKVLESSKGLFVAMPQYKVGNDYKDICFPCTKEAREELNNAVMNAYEQALTQKQTQAQTDAPTPQQTQAMSGQSM
jgi:stage V sporulation protein G